MTPSTVPLTLKSPYPVGELPQEISQLNGQIKQQQAKACPALLALLALLGGCSVVVIIQG